MTLSTALVPRLQIVAFVYELIPNDLLVNDSDGATRRVASVDGAATVTVAFDDDSTQDFPRRALVTIYRDQSELPPIFQTLPPTIVA